MEESSVLAILLCMFGLYDISLDKRDVFPQFGDLPDEWGTVENPGRGKQHVEKYIARDPKRHREV